MEWKLAPKEPTREMFMVGAEHTDSERECPECGHITLPDTHTAYGRAFFVYSEMLSKAPSPWTKITDDPATWPTEDDGDELGMVMCIFRHHLSGRKEKMVKAWDLVGPNRGLTHWCPMIDGPEG